jgi:hypothetical protein
MFRDEWPIAGVAIAHALENYVDTVVVIDHKSTDGASQGLASLEKHYPGRIIRFFLPAEGFFQTASQLTAMSQLDQEAFDWVYVFDADEFLIEGEQFSLRQYLADIPKEVGAVSYRISNWVMQKPKNNDFEPNDLLLTRNRVLPKNTVPNGFQEKYDAIFNGKINYLDMPASNKVIVRSKHFTALRPGAHSTIGKVHAINASEHEFSVAHVPFYSKAKLNNRVAHGKNQRSLHFHRSHSWHNGLLYDLSLAGRLDQFWETVKTDNDSAAMPVNLIEDPRLALTLEATLKTINENDVLSLGIDKSLARELNMDDALKTIDLLWKEMNLLREAQRPFSKRLVMKVKKLIRAALPKKN